MPLKEYIEEELNTPNIIFEKNTAPYVKKIALPNNKDLGVLLKKDFNKEFITSA